MPGVIICDDIYKWIKYIRVEFNKKTTFHSSIHSSVLSDDGIIFKYFKQNT